MELIKKAAAAAPATGVLATPLVASDNIEFTATFDAYDVSVADSAEVSPSQLTAEIAIT